MAGNSGQMATMVTDIALRLCRAVRRASVSWSPCGLCLAYRNPVLLSYPARVVAYFNAVEPPIVEGLVVPISYAGEASTGTKPSA